LRDYYRTIVAKYTPNRAPFLKLYMQLKTLNSIQVT